jgi:hypothetical protein
LLEKITQNKLLFIILHLVLGYLGTLSFFPAIYGLFSIIIPVIVIFITKNKNEEALFFAAYIAGAEVFIRMIDGFVFYETGKYAVILFLMMGIIFGKFKQVFAPQYIFYVLLLLLGIVLTRVPEGESIRKNILFNLSGPFSLGAAAFYCYQRQITLKRMLDILFSMLLPIFSTIAYLYLRTPKLSEIVFRGASNFSTSGGYGPNQVATVIGVGIFLLTIYLVSRQKLSGYLFLDVIFLIYFSYRGLLTFSRGGLLTGFIAIVTFLFFYIMYRKIGFGIIFKYIIISTVFILAIWLYTLNITNGMLNNRYSNQNASGVQKEDLSSGRGDIIDVQFNNFLENPLGIGVGNGKYARLQEVNVTGASHNEVGRLLEEHGYIGVIILLLLLLNPLLLSFKSNHLQRAFLLSFYLIWFLTINHSAMRVALPGFIYGLSLVKITKYEE